MIVGMQVRQQQLLVSALVKADVSSAVYLRVENLFGVTGCASAAGAVDLDVHGDDLVVLLCNLDLLLVPEGWRDLALRFDALYRTFFLRNRLDGFLEFRKVSLLRLFWFIRCLGSRVDEGLENDSAIQSCID